jgi:Phosphotransferase enzyme family
VGERDRVLAAAEAGQRTLCHLDFWPANLADSAGTSVLFDWAFAGEGAVGEDLANLIIDAFTDGLMEVGLLPELAGAGLDGYLAGLRDGGWAGPLDAVRAAVHACGAAKYSWFGPAMAVRAARDDLGRSSYRRDTSAAKAIRRLTPLVTLIADWAGRCA